jgi:hypothetical protein
MRNMERRRRGLIENYVWDDVVDEFEGILEGWGDG